MKSKKKKSKPKQTQTAATRHESSVKEIHEIFVFITILAVTFFTWLFGLGWSPEKYMQSGDGLPILAWMQHILSGSTWNKIFYQPHLIGGSQGLQIHGSLAGEHLWGWTGLGPVAAGNLTIIMTQALMAYFGFKMVQQISRRWSNNQVLKPVFSAEGIGRMVGITWLIGFAPFIAWRVSHGHPNILLGVLFFIIVSSVIVSSLQRNFSPTYWVMVLFGLSFALPNSGHQLRLYSLSFGLPILVALIWVFRTPNSWKNSGKNLLVGLIAGVTGLLIILPLFWPMLAAVLSSDATRTIGEQSVIYSYTTGTMQDWLSSIPWAHEFIAYGRETFLHHEINYPFGPLLLALAYLLTKKKYFVASGTIFSFLLAIVFANKVPVISDVIANVIPLVKSFRVPERAILPALAFLPILAAAALLERTGRTKTSYASLAGLPILALVGIVVLPPGITELVAWCFLGAALFVKHKPLNSISSGAWILSLGVISVSAFGQRLLPMQGHDIMSQAESLGKTIRLQIPATNHPLTRVRVPQLPGLGVDTAFGAGLSSIDGYSNPLSRFNRLVSHLEGKPVTSTRLVFDFPPSSQVFAAVQRLYNVCCVARQNAKGGISLQTLSPTLGAAWFSRTIEFVDDYSQLATRLRTNSSSELRDHGLVIASDAATKQLKGTPAASQSQCQPSSLKTPDYDPDTQTFTIETAHKGECYLTLATNYMDGMTAKGFRGSSVTKLPIYPVYGALIGVKVPDGISKVTIEPGSYNSWWVIGLSALGWLSALGLVGFMIFRSKLRTKDH